MTDWETKELVRLQAEYGTIPPPWTVQPNVHPYSSVWRAGKGAALLALWRSWWYRQCWWQAEQFNYFIQFPPPIIWLEWVIFALWPDAEKGYYQMDEATRHAHLKPYFQRLKALNFGSYEQWQTEMKREIY